MRKANIFLVEDNEAIRAALTANFEFSDNEYRVVGFAEAASDVNQALEDLPDEDQPQVVISDYRLRDGDAKGVEAVEVVRQRVSEGLLGHVAIIGFSSREDGVPGTDIDFVKGATIPSLIRYIDALPERREEV